MECRYWFYDTTLRKLISVIAQNGLILILLNYRIAHFLSHFFLSAKNPLEISYSGVIKE